TSLVELGELERAWETYETARDAARRFGDAPGLHWLAAGGPYEPERGGGGGGRRSDRPSCTGGANGTLPWPPPSRSCTSPTPATAGMPAGASGRGSGLP